MTNNPTLLQKLKKLTADGEYDEDIVYKLTLQEYLDNINDIKYHITTNPTTISDLFSQTVYTRPKIVYSFGNFDLKKDGVIRKWWVWLEKGGMKMT